MRSVRRHDVTEIIALHTLTDNLQPELVDAAERRQITTVEDNVAHGRGLSLEASEPPSWKPSTTHQAIATTPSFAKSPFDGASKNGFEIEDSPPVDYANADTQRREPVVGDDSGRTRRRCASRPR